MAVHILGLQVQRQHQHLRLVEQLGYLLGGPLGTLVLGGHPGLGGLLDDAGLKASVVRLDGAVETACRLGVADAVCDVVETGTTLRAAGLRIIGEPVLTSEAVLVRREGAEEIPAVAQLLGRLRGVMVARQYVLLDYDCPNALLEQATALTPGLEGPTVSPLQTEGWSAVRFSGADGAWKRTTWWVPSQKGRMRDFPHRHRATVRRCGEMVSPSWSRRVTGPRTR